VTDEEVLQRFPEASVLKGSGGALPRRAFEPSRIRAAIDAGRERGVLTPDDDLQAAAPLVKYTQGQLFFTAPFAPLALMGAYFFYPQKACLLLVTQRHVMLTGWTFPMGPETFADTLRLDRPVQLALSQEPKEFQGANPVALPAEAAEFLGRQTVYAQLGKVVAEAFRIAVAPPRAA
jgi:hypothetical protein